MVINASGGPEDGSLHGFYTACGRRIEHGWYWVERPDGIVTCGNCLRCVRAEDIDHGPLPGVRDYPEAIRRKVAEGPLFEIERRAGGSKVVYVNAEGDCVAQALVRHEPPRSRAIPDERLRLIHELIERNDRGDYADRDKLRRDLLGAGAHHKGTT